MKTLAFIYIIATAIVVLSSCNNEKEQESLIQNHTDSLSYSLGMMYAQNIPENLNKNHIDSVSYEIFIQGIQDYFDTTHIAELSNEEIISLTNTFLENRQSKLEQAFIDSHKVVNIPKGESFLEENKNKRGIVELEEGLQYQIIRRGWGQNKPTIHDTVFLEYKIYNTDNTLLYNSTEEYNTPQKISLDSAITAWQKVIPLLRTGAQVRIMSSHTFAYQDSYSKKLGIMPFSTLIFDVKLRRFIKGEQPSQPETTNQTQQTEENTVTRTETQNNTNETVSENEETNTEETIQNNENEDITEDETIRNTELETTEQTINENTSSQNNNTDTIN
ncbi:MAG: FKBP-type peptidyl-prolyl cis-trans isomerase N-terminal domain-containing protein [Bacteroidales bacterium]